MIKSQIHKKDRIISIVTGIISVIVVVFMLIWGIRTWLFSNKYETTNDAQVEMYINPITSRLTGYIKEIKFEENQEVKKGDTLVIIDNSDYQVQLDAAKAALDNGKAQIGILDEEAYTAEKDVLVSQSKIAAAKAKLNNAQKEYNRYKELYDLQSATGQQLENKEAALEIAKSEYQSALQTVQVSQAKVNAIKSQKNAAKAEIDRRNAVSNSENLTLSYTVITAPYDGIMGRRTLQTGQLVQPGQTLAYIVDSNSGKWIIANFKETQIGKMKIGDAVSIEIDAIPNEKFEGSIQSFAAATGSKFSVMPPDNSTGNFVKTAQRIPVKILIKPEKNTDKILAGMNANVFIKKSK